MSDFMPNSENAENAETAAISEDETDFLAVGAPSNTRAVRRNFRSLIVVLVVIAIGIGLGFTFLSKSRNIDPAMSQGKVALSETKLKQVISDRHVVAFWTGPMVGAKYALTITNAGLVYIRYLPGGVGVTDIRANFRVVGSYPFPKAYEWAVSNGALPGVIGLTNPDGFAIFYNVASTGSAYLATKNQEVQIEIYDPIPNQARALAMIKGQVQQVA